MTRPEALPLGEPLPEDLQPTRFIESDHPAVRAFALAAADAAVDSKNRAVKLFYAVRDGIRYDAYALSADPDTYRASNLLAKGAGFCIPKAVLYAAGLRALGIPARLGFADVRNHLATERLRRLMDTDLFIYHGFTVAYLGGRWIKATPTFNIELCERFGVKAMDFDGEHDALLQPFDRSGRRHMEYVADHGAFADLPLDTILTQFREVYPALLAESGDAHDFAAEAAAETNC